MPLLAAGCGAPARHPASTGSPPVARADAGAAIEAELPSLDTLAASGAGDAPLMRESLRVERVDKSVSVTAAADACFRAIVGAAGPVHAWFEDGGHAVRGDAANGDRRAVVPSRGPACAKKGESLRLFVEPGRARAVIFQAP